MREMPAIERLDHALPYSYILKLNRAIGEDAQAKLAHLALYLSPDRSSFAKSSSIHVGA
jgi:hypothetical protein